MGYDPGRESRGDERVSIFSAMWGLRCIEPVKRNKDGMQWIVHRFPIKGGITLREAMVRDMMAPNTLILEKSAEIGELTFRDIPIRVQENGFKW